jgi:hypothetical protein
MGDPQRTTFTGVSMAMKVKASFENGVFVPATQPRLVDRERVVLTVEPASNSASASRAFTDRDAITRPASQPDHALVHDYHPDGC